MIFKYYSVFIVIAVQNFCLAQISTFDDVSSKSPPNFESITSFSSFPSASVGFQPALSTVTGTSDSFGKPTYNFPRENDFSQPAATASGGPFLQTSQPSTIPSPLETFISTFTNAVHISPIVSDLFDVSDTSVQSLKNFIYQDVRAIMGRLGISDSVEAATYSSQPFAENFEILTYPMKARIDANAMGKHLLAEGILNDTNAVSLALAFANEMETSAKNTVQKNDTKSKFRALMDGYVGFLKSQGLFTPEKMLDAIRYVGNEVELAGKLFGTSARNYASVNV